MGATRQVSLRDTKSDSTKELPAWIQKGGDQVKATALMQKLEQQLNAKNFDAAEKTADSILEMIGPKP